MKYIKIILTVIAVLLVLNLIKPMLIKDAMANRWTNVNISAIGGYQLFDSTISVKNK